MSHHLSIFNFETLRSPCTDAFRSKALWLCTIALILLEIVVRVVSPADSYPRGAWHNSELRRQANQIESLKGINLYFVGSSVSAVNISPIAFDEELKSTRIQTTSFNTGIRGCSYTCIKNGFLSIYWAKKQSDIVVLVVAPEDVNEGNLHVKFRSEKFIDTFNKTRLDKWFQNLTSNFYLIGFSAEIKQYLRFGSWPAEPFRLAPRGHVPVSQTLRRFNPEYHFDQNGLLATSLFELAEFLKNEGVKVILLEGLSDSTTWSKIGEVENDTFWDIMHAIAQKLDLPLVNVQDIRPADSDFVDGLHINSKAAEQFSKSLAKLLLDKRLL